VSSAPAVRRAYEKRRRPGGGRWGRVEGVPLTVYYELDDLRAQLTGLSSLIGTTRQDLYALTRVGPGVIEDGMEPVSLRPGIPESLRGRTFIQVREQTRGLIPSAEGAYATNAFTVPYSLVRESRIVRFRALPVIDPAGTDFPYVTGILRFIRMDRPSPLVSLRDAEVLHAEVVTLNDQVWYEVPYPQFSKLKWYDQGTTFRGQFDPDAGTNTAILFEITVLQKEPYLIE
jgi:hypothetical protein